MGGSSKGDNNSTSKTTFANTAQNNPYFNSTTDAYGNTTTNFKQGTAGETTYNFVNDNISNLLNDYLNPNLNSATNKAKINAFNKQQNANLQNNIINPLANNNMVRSSQATNMYNNLSNQAADYTNQLIANNQNDTWNMINNLMALYQAGYQGVSNEQKNSRRWWNGVNKSVKEGSLWLDNSEYPLNLKQYDGSNWQTNNDLVYLGDVTVGNGVITAITNAEFNKYLYLLSPVPVIIEKSDPSLMPSWYRVYSDGWIEQGGAITPSGSGAQDAITVTLLKKFSNTNYFVVANYCAISTYQYGQCHSLTEENFKTRGYGGTKSVWYACGYGA